MSASSDRIDRAVFLKRLGGLFAVALLDRGMLSTVSPAASDLHHPEPRADVNADHVLSADDIGKKKDVIAAYDAAREYPATFDGIACGCGCSGEKAAEHRSLLVCYETRQPMGCGSCREEASFVARLVKQGKTLAEIRTSVDKKFG